MATAAHRRSIAGEGTRSSRGKSRHKGAPRTGAKRTVLHYIRQLPHFVRLLFGLISDPRVAMVDKLLVFGAIAYIVTPIDLIPDFIPVLGYLDDLIVVPAGILLVVRLIPPEIMAQHRAAAAAASARPVSRGAAAIVIAIWVVCTLLAGWLVYPWFALDGIHNLR